jgi:isopenicillin-N epimerase
MKPEPASPLALETPAAPPDLWPVDPDVTFLNHGSFGSCPNSVLEFQNQIRLRLERQPIRFFVRDLEELWDNARKELATFVGAMPDDLVFVPNATAGINTVLRSLTFHAGDELLVTDHEYNACRNALNYVAARAGAKIVVVQLSFPLSSSVDIIQAIEARVTPRTRLALIDHVTSQTGLVLPLADMVQSLARSGVDVLVDGAHAPGMVPLDLVALGAAYYTGNCHKWLCAPKGAAFLHVHRDRQEAIRPLVISHGANSSRSDRSRFLIEFGWMGTGDPSAALSVPEAIRFMGSLLPGGWPAVMQRNHELALAGRKNLCEALGIAPPCPDEWIGSLASLPLPDSTTDAPSKSPLYLDPLQDWLMENGNIEVPVIPWPAPPKRLIRISAQLYNSLPQYRQLARALPKALAVSTP